MRCGIDFGTSNTMMAVLHPGGPRPVALENESHIVPTAIFFPENNSLPILFGRAAIHAYLAGEEGRLMRSLKRVLGTSLMQQGTVVRGARWSFNDIIRQFFEHVKHQAEMRLSAALTAVTIGRPVHFQDHDPQADARAEQQLRDIAMASGFESVDFRYEPVAAALAHEKTVKGEQLALVVDIGGGTSDFSVIRLSCDYTPERNRSQDILANYGVRIGGNDCDKTINVATAMPLLGMHSLYGRKNLQMPHAIYYDLSEWSRVNGCYTPQNINMVRALLREAHDAKAVGRLEKVLEEQLGHHVLDVSENIKIALTEKDSARADYGFIEDGLAASVERAYLDSWLQETLAPVESAMLESLHLAGVTPQEIALVVLTGGTTALPQFRRWLAHHMPHAAILDDNRMGSVGMGLVL